jgi:hypothetical protein
MGIMLYYGNLQYSASVTNILVPGAVGLALFMDGVVADRVKTMISGRGWTARFLPALVVMHLGVALIGLRLLYESWPLQIIAYLVAFVGFAWCINQVG